MKRLLSLSLLFTGSLVGCSFLTDFEELQSGNDDAGGAPGTGGTESPNSGGAPASGGASLGGLGGMGGVLEDVPLANFSFETGNLEGWTVEPEASVTAPHLFVQPPTGTVLPPDGTYQLSYWHGTEAYDVTLFQELTGVVDGTYELQAFISRGASVTANLFAKDCAGPGEVTSDVTITDPTSFTLFRLSDVVISGGSCTVGLRVTAPANSSASAWLNVDSFRLAPQY